MTRLFVATGFVIAFTAGLMVGLVTHHRPMPPQPGPGGRGGWIASQLELSPDQTTKMREIWQDVSHHGGREQGMKRQAIRHDTDEAVAKLIRPEDQAAYDKLMKDTHDKLDAIDSDGRRAFQQAVEKTKAILTPDQRAKYETLMARPPEGRGPDNHGPDGRNPDHRGPDGPPPAPPGEPATRDDRP